MNRNKLLAICAAIEDAIEYEDHNLYRRQIATCLTDARDLILQALGYCTIDERDCQRFAEADAAIQANERDDKLRASIQNAITEASGLPVIFPVDRDFMAATKSAYQERIESVAAELGMVAEVAWGSDLHVRVKLSPQVKS